MSVKIIVDSAADLSDAYIKDHQITVIPMVTIFGDTEYLEGVTISHREFYEKLVEDDKLPRTSQIAPYQFEELYSQVAANGDTAVVISLSSKLSGTYQNAALAALAFPDCIYTVDSMNVTCGEQILVKLAVKLVNEGLSAAETAAILEVEKKKVRIIALLDTLEYLKKGGRIPSSVALIGNMLSIKPVVTVSDGEVVILGKARGSKKGNNMLTEEIEKSGGIDFDKPLSLGYTGLSDVLLQKYIEDSASIWKAQIDALPICTIGSTIGTHVGPGAIALAYFEKN